MRRFVAASFLSTLVLFPLFGYVYVRGEIDGIARYRDSRQFALTLLSMYQYGVWDACKDRHLCGR